MMEIRCKMRDEEVEEIETYNDTESGDVAERGGDGGTGKRELVEVAEHEHGRNPQQELRHRHHDHRQSDPIHATQLRPS